MINIFIAEIPQTFDAQRSAENFKKAFTGEANSLYMDKLLEKNNLQAKNQSVCALCVLSKGLLELPVNTQGLTLSKSINGKPYFVSECAPHFSISHDNNTVVVAISDEHVGIDIQSPRDTERSHSIAERFFSDNEARDVISGDADFLTLWTKKEALCKLSDTPLSLLAKKELPCDVFFKTMDYKNFKISVASYTYQDVKITLLSEI